MADCRRLTLKEIEELKKLKAEKSGIAESKTPQSAARCAIEEETWANRRDSGIKPCEPGIVINRMYVGGYLESNLGHEIINLFQADNGQHYLYLNSSGSFAREHRDIGYMLMVKYAGSDTFEVIGLAKGLEYASGADRPRNRTITELDENISSEQRDYIKSQPGGDIRYAGISILDIFNDAEQQSVFITYKAEKVWVPQGEMRIFLCYRNDAVNYFDKNKTLIAVRKHNLPKTSLKSYIYPESKISETNDWSDYDNLVANLIDNMELWTSDRNWKVTDNEDFKKRETSLFDICKIQDDENRFSNALAYFMTCPHYRSLWIEFFKSYGISLQDNYIVEREASAKILDQDKAYNELPSGGRIDLLISDDNYLIVIENKIKSDINLTVRDKNGVTQLDRYVNYVEWRKVRDSKKREGIFLILCPDYNIPDLSESVKDKYRIITYSQLYQYLDGFSEVDTDNNFRALRNAMHRHTHTTVNGYLYNEILEKFTQRIKESRTSKTSIIN